jgi:hypothetical protein
MRIILHPAENRGGQMIDPGVRSLSPQQVRRSHHGHDILIEKRNTTAQCRRHRKQPEPHLVRQAGNGPDAQHGRVQRGYYSRRNQRPGCGALPELLEGPFPPRIVVQLLEQGAACQFALQLRLPPEAEMVDLERDGHRRDGFMICSHACSLAQGV